VISDLRQIPGVLQVYPKIESYSAAAANGQFTVAVVRGLTAADLRATPIIAKNIKQGSLDGFGEGEYGGELVILGTGLAAQMGVGPGDPVTLYSPTGAATPFGSSLQEKTYTVGGVFEAGMSLFDASYVFMPLEQAQLFFGKEPAVDSIDIRLENPDNIDRLLPQVERAAGPGGIVTDWTDRHRSYFTALEVERNVMRLILMLIVAIAAMNIISGLVMLVKNKGRDVAVLRTMGATQGSILRIFFMSGAAVGAAGTLAGLLLGVVFCTFIGEIQGFVEWATGTQVFSRTSTSSRGCPRASNGPRWPRSPAGPSLCRAWSPCRLRSGPRASIRWRHSGMSERPIPSWRSGASTATTSRATRACTC
jgi:lipoprotein-releasing system permease protein